MLLKAGHFDVPQKIDDGTLHQKKGHSYIMSDVFIL